MKRPAKAGFAGIASTALLIAASLVLAMPPRLARADAQQQSFRVWNQMADCARLAAKQYPDHTPEANAKREAARQNCLRQRHLPVIPASPQAGAEQ